MVARSVDKIKFIDVAQARHSSSKLDSALTKPQHSRRAGCEQRALSMIKTINQKLTTASTLFCVEAVVSYL